jgi:hypothetical protein
MNIYIDESGSFVNAAKRDSWNVVVAYALPETEFRSLKNHLKNLKIGTGHSCTQEVKLRDIGERPYFSFLDTAARLRGVVLCTATDAGLNSNQAVAATEKSKQRG